MISGPPSLRRRLLAFLALPMLGLLIFNTVLAYYVALDYSNRIHDRNLVDDTHSFAQMLSTMPVTSDLSPQARFLIEYDPDGHRYFNVDSSRKARSAATLISARMRRPRTAPACTRRCTTASSMASRCAWPRSARRR